MACELHAMNGIAGTIQAARDHPHFRWRSRQTMYEQHADRASRQFESVGDGKR